MRFRAGEEMLSSHRSSASLVTVKGSNNVQKCAVCHTWHTCCDTAEGLSARAGRSKCGRTCPLVTSNVSSLICSEVSPVGDLFPQEKARGTHVFLLWLPPGRHLNGIWSHPLGPSLWVWLPTYFYSFPGHQGPTLCRYHKCWSFYGLFKLALGFWFPSSIPALTLAGTHLFRSWLPSAACPLLPAFEAQPLTLACLANSLAWIPPSTPQKGADVFSDSWDFMMKHLTQNRKVNYH